MPPLAIGMYGSRQILNLLVPLFYLTYVPHQSQTVASESTVELDPEELIPYEPAFDSTISDYDPMDIEAPVTLATLNSPFVARVRVLKQQLQKL